MKKLEHYIFTRFNVDIYNREDAEDWMQHRIKLFEKYTLPSLTAQTCKDFTWLLYFDERTPADTLCRYDYMDNIQIIFDYHKDWIQEQAIDSEWVLTSRIDNDDYYDKEFVEQVQEVAYEYIESCNEPLIIDVGGLQYAEKLNRFFTNGRVRNNSPFISLLEPNDGDLKTVYFCSHTHMPEHFQSMKIEESLSYMVIHDWNVSNKIVGDLIK